MALMMPSLLDRVVDVDTPMLHDRKGPPEKGVRVRQSSVKTHVLPGGGWGAHARWSERAEP